MSVTVISAVLMAMTGAPEATPAIDGKTVSVEIAVEKTGLDGGATSTARALLSLTKASAFETPASDDFYWTKGALTPQGNDAYRLNVTICAPGADECRPAALPAMVFKADEPASITAELDGFTYRLDVSPAQ